MKTVKKISFYSLLVICSLALIGCGKKADESKTLSEVKAEAEKMSVAQLQSMAMNYKESIVAKKSEVDKLMDKLMEIPATEKLSTEAKELSNEIENLNKSLAALTERFEIYYNKLKEKGGDLTGLEL